MDAGAIPWRAPGWRGEVEAWIDARLDERNQKRVGALEPVRAQPWSAVWRVPTDGEPVYVKATAPSLAHEPALTEQLHRWRPDLVTPVLAVEPERAWLLMRDMGRPLRELVPSVRELGRWETVLDRYAELQIELADRVDALLALEPLERRLETLPAQLDTLLDETDALLLGQPDGLAREEHGRLRARVPELQKLCARLLERGVPQTLHQEDFHDHNVFVRDGVYRLGDWGDCGVSHPFCSVFVTLRSLGYRLGLDVEGSALGALRDRYLSHWSDFGSMDALRETYALATRAAMVCRALTWRRVTAGLPTELVGEHAAAVPGWLQVFLEAMDEDASHVAP